MKMKIEKRCKRSKMKKKMNMKNEEEDKQM